MRNVSESSRHQGRSHDRHRIRSQAASRHNKHQKQSKITIESEADVQTQGQGAAIPGQYGFFGWPMGWSSGMGIGRMMEDMYSAFNETVRELSAPVRAAIPPSDLEDLDNEYRVYVDIPGVPLENIEVEVNVNQVCVRGERKSSLDEHVPEAVNRLSERTYGEFERIFLLTSPIDADKAKVQYDNGVLSVIVPKLKVKESKTIRLAEKSEQQGARQQKDKEEESRAEEDMKKRPPKGRQEKSQQAEVRH